MANKQVNIRLPKKLLSEGHSIVQDFNYKNMQHLIIEGLRKIILEHQIKREVEAIKQFQDIHREPPMDVPDVDLKELANKYGLNKFK